MDGRTSAPIAAPPRQHTAVPVIVRAPRLATRLKAQMKTKGIGVRALADQTRVDKATISAWRMGTQKRVRVQTVRQVAAKLDTTAEHLLDMPPGLGSGGSASSEQVELLRRVAALSPTLTALSKRPSGLSLALERHGRRIAEIEQILADLEKLANAAKRQTK